MSHFKFYSAGPLPIEAFEDALSFIQLHNLLDYLGGTCKTPQTA